MYFSGLNNIPYTVLKMKATITFLVSKQFYEFSLYNQFSSVSVSFIHQNNHVFSFALG